MGIEAFILPWLFAMALVAISGLISLARRFGLVRYRERFVPSVERNGTFWCKQTVKGAIVAFALWQMYLILKRVI